MNGRSVAAFVSVLALSVTPSARADDVRTDFHPGDDPVATSRIADALRFLAGTFPELRDVTIGTALLPSIFYAQAGDGKIAFNTVYMTYSPYLESQVADNSRIHFHPALGRCTGAEFLTFHESAHIIDARKGNVPSKALADLYGDGANLAGQLSGYSFKDGKLNAPEALAEGFASTLCNGGNAIERGIYRLVSA